MSRCRTPFLLMAALGLLLGAGRFCAPASAQNPGQPDIFMGLAALSDSGMAGVAAKGIETGSSVEAGRTQPSLQLWDEIRPAAKPALPSAGIVTITVNTGR